MLYIFIDTNIVMHFKQVQDIDWLALTNAKECTIVVAPVVVDELESNKRGHDKKTKRIQAFLKILLAYYDSEGYELSENVGLTVLTNLPSRDFMQTEQLIFEQSDQKLLASIIQFQESSDKKDVRLCTDDVGAIGRAKHRKVQILRLPEQYELPPEVSEEEKEIRRLKQQNEKLTNQVTEISLLSRDGKTFVSLEKKASPDFTCEEYVASRMEELKELYPPFDLSSQETNNNKPWSSPWSGHERRPSDTEMNAYNRNLETFYQKHPKIFTEEYELIRHDGLYYSLNLILAVGGSVPAKGVELTLDFPENLWVEKASLVKTKEIDFPEPPHKPRWEGDYPSPSFHSTYALPKLNELPPFDSIFANTTHVISNGKQRRVNFTVRGSLKHQKDEDLPELVIKFLDYTQVKGFNFHYEISAENLPTPNNGEMNVKFINPENQIADRLPTG